jgi:hypothetical protein
MSSSSSGPQGLVQSTSTGLDDSPLSDSISFTPQSLSIRTEQNSTGSTPQDSFTLSSQDRPQDSTLPSSQGSVQDSIVLTSQDSAVSSSQGSAVRTSRDPAIPKFDESTAQISQVTDLIQNIKQHVSEENTAHTQASLDHIILHVTNLVFEKQIYLQELANKCVEIEKKNDTITTLRGEIDVQDTTTSNLQTQIKEKNDTLLEKSNAITKLIKSNVIKENRIKELEAQIESKDVALQQKVKTITEVNLSNSTKDDEIKHLEAQAKEKDDTITALENKLTYNIIDRNKSKQEYDPLGLEISRRQDPILRGMANDYNLYFGASRRPSFWNPGYSHGGGLSDQIQGINSRPSMSQKLLGDSLTNITVDPSQGYDPQPISFREPAKATSIDWSTITTRGHFPPHPQLDREVDSQLRDDGIRWWLSGVGQTRRVHPAVRRAQRESLSKQDLPDTQGTTNEKKKEGLK